MLTVDQAVQQREVIMAFLRIGVWSVSEGRVKAYNAAMDFLMRVPSTVRRFIMEERHLLLIAPPFGSPASVYPYTFRPDGRDEALTRFQIVYLEPRLENLPVEVSLAMLAKCVANALQAVYPPGHEYRAMNPEELVVFWGFRKEVAAVERLRRQSREKRRSQQTEKQAVAVN